MKSKKTRHRFRRVGALLLALVLCAGLVPSAFAIQDNAYHDPRRALDYRARQDG